MQQQTLPQGHQLVRVKADPTGTFTAEVGEMPELRVTASSREDALAQLRQLLQGQLLSGELALLDVGTPQPDGTRRVWAGHAKDDPDFDAYLEEIRRYREVVDQQPCSSTSLTPIT